MRDSFLVCSKIIVDFFLGLRLYVWSTLSWFGAIHLWTFFLVWGYNFVGLFHGLEQYICRSLSWFGALHLRDSFLVCCNTMLGLLFGLEPFVGFFLGLGYNLVGLFNSFELYICGTPSWFGTIHYWDSFFV